VGVQVPPAAPTFLYQTNLKKFVSMIATATCGLDNKDIGKESLN